MKKFAKKVAVSALALVGMAQVAQAASGNWMGYANGPTIYQTNWAYYSAWVNPPSYVPTTAQITGLNWSVNFNPVPPSLVSYFMTTNNGYLQLPGMSGTIGIGGGASAKQAMRFGFVSASSPTRVLSPYSVGGGHMMNVLYSY